MSVVNITPGMIVMACAGRDKDSFFVALESHDGLVFIANGKERKLESPKKKNIRHISPTDTVIKLDGLTNKKLRRLLAEYEPDTKQNADCTP
ncbi:MAG: KOW domain-containing RNA-binding protein [Oscillospiraceae bacterium]|nr:KOW domain-containing RNA-binding protein [Oscillospiraceae bacterium]